MQHTRPRAKGSRLRLRVLRAPAVLDDVGVLGHADDQDAVVELVPARSSVVERARLVVLEVRVVGFDGDGDRVNHDCRLHLGLVLVLHVREVVDGGDDALLSSRPAHTILGGVVVVLLRVDPAVGHDVLEASLHDATLATVVALLRGAVHELLLGERAQLAGGEEERALCGAGGGERPAGALRAVGQPQRQSARVRDSGVR